MMKHRLSGSTVLHVAFVALAAYVIWVAHDLPAGGGMMPIFAAAGVIVFSAYQIFQKTVLNRDAPGTRIIPPLSKEFTRSTMVFALSAGYLFLIFRLGYFSSTLVFLCVSASALGVKSWRAIAITAIALLVAMYGFFILFLGAHLPKGLII
jgi:hypothetical protein